MKTVPIVPLLLCLSGCAEGGEDDRLTCDQPQNATHRVFSFRSVRGFGDFPPTADDVFTTRAVFTLGLDCMYSLANDIGTTTSRYALANDGSLSIVVPALSNSEPQVTFLGAYDLVGADGQRDVLFTDRVSTQGSPSIGLYYGTRLRSEDEPVELEGDWHLLSLHAIFNQTTQTTENVGRAAYGSLNVPASSTGMLAEIGEQRTMTGTGLRSTRPLNTSGVALDFMGSVIRYLRGTGEDGEVTLTLNYGADARTLQAHANENVVYALDPDDDDESGMAMMVRKFDTMAAPADDDNVWGNYLIGGHTLFVDPGNSGSDTFIGVVRLTNPDGFTLTAVSNTGQEFQYTGSYTLDPDGKLTIAINGTGETWFAAIDRTYNLLALVDPFEETRVSGSSELNFGIGVRQSSQ